MMASKVPESLLEARATAGLTQVALAAGCGVSPQAVSQWERGETTPFGPARRLLSQVLGLPLDVIDSWFERREAA